MYLELRAHGERQGGELTWYGDVGIVDDEELRRS